LGLALLFGVLGPALAAGAELRAGTGVRIVQAAGVSAAEQVLALSADGTARGAFTLTAAPKTAVSLSIEALPAPGAPLPPGGSGHDAGPTPATDATGALTVRFDAAATASPASYRIIVHY
jgi:hypothetical protein